jgi:hypothetical protein
MRFYAGGEEMILYRWLLQGDKGGATGPSVNVQGTWSGTAQQTGSQNPTFILKLNQRKDGEIWGTMTSKDGTFQEAIISGGKISGNKLTFSATANGTNLRSGRSFTFDADVQEETMDGTWKDILDRSWGPFTLVYEKESAKGKEDTGPAPSKSSQH